MASLIGVKMAAFIVIAGILFVIGATMSATGVVDNAEVEPHDNIKDNTKLQALVKFLFG